MKEILLHANAGGKMLTLYSVQIRRGKETERGYLIHDESDEACENDRISGGIAGVDAPKNYEELETLFRLAFWTSDFHIDNQGVYVFDVVEV